MAIILRRIAGGISHAKLMIDEINYGVACFEAAQKREFGKDRSMRDALNLTIRNAGGAIGNWGNFKNGCLYREEGLQEFWNRRNNEDVVCDHVAPVSTIVDQLIEFWRNNQEKKINFKKAICRAVFMPVARIRKKSNDSLTQAGFANSGYNHEFPFSRYNNIEINIITHNGDKINLQEWKINDHWHLLRETREMNTLISDLEDHFGESFLQYPLNSMDSFLKHTHAQQ